MYFKRASITERYFNPKVITAVDAGRRYSKIEIIHALSEIAKTINKKHAIDFSN
jgi:hypothetical protein